LKNRKKLVVVGDGACGKTSLLLVQSGKPFPEVYIKTNNKKIVIKIIYFQ